MFVSPETAARFQRDARAILHLGGPLLVNNLVLAGMSVTNTIAAGRVGPEALAGVALETGGGLWRHEHDGPRPCRGGYRMGLAF